MLPDGWNLRVLVREVVECAKVLEAQGSQVSEVEDGKAVRAGCCGVLAVAYGPFDLCGGESVRVAVKWVLPGLRVWGTGRVNYLQKWVAIFCGLVWVVLWVDIGWLGSWLVLLPERLLKTFQYLREFRDREQESIRSSHSCCRRKHGDGCWSLQ